MAASSPDRPLHVLVRNLLLAALLAVALFSLFTVFNTRVLHGFTATEILLLEAGAIVLVGYLVARSITRFTNAMLARQGIVGRSSAVRLVLNILIAVATVLALFKLAGVSAESIFIGAGFTGIVLGLASQTVLSNVFAGILLVFADPFRPGDRVSFVTWAYGVMPPSYPHEATYPTYGGTIEDVGLIYTVLALDQGGFAKLPNAVVLGALVLQPRGPLVHRVRMTFPNTTAVSVVEAVLPEVAAEFPPPFTGAPAPRLEVTDLSPTTWDAVVVLWSTVRDPGTVRDRVLRAVLPRLGRPAAA